MEPENNTFPIDIEISDNLFQNNYQNYEIYENLKVRDIDKIIHRWLPNDTINYETSDNKSHLDHQNNLIKLFESYPDKVKIIINNDTLKDILRAGFFTLFNNLLNERIKYDINENLFFNNYKFLEIIFRMLMKVDFINNSFIIPVEEYRSIKNIKNVYKDNYDNYGEFKNKIITYNNDLQNQKETIINKDWWKNNNNRQTSEDYVMNVSTDIKFEDDIWEYHPEYLNDMFKPDNLDLFLEKINIICNFFIEDDFDLDINNELEGGYKSYFYKYKKYKNKYYNLKNK